ncbi:hypothetical protein NG797_08285 [Laspinema sp. D5]|nr:hypothetical protein [Laspinema sp. D3d]
MGDCWPVNSAVAPNLAPLVCGEGAIAVGLTSPLETGVSDRPQPGLN